MEGRLVWGTSLEDGWRKGPWTPQEDKLLIDHVNMHGEGRWNSVSKLTGLRRSGKSCRLRWVNYLRPDLKRGKITPQEERLILELHAKWGNRWSTIARSLPGRTDNEIKNYWRTHFKKGESSKNVERAKARFLKQQQELNHQQHQLQLQLQLQLQREEKHQKHHNNQIEMKNVLPQVVGEAALAQEMDELLACMYPLSSYLHQGGASSFVSEPSSEDATWGSLWNLDDAGLIIRDQALNYS